MPVGGLNPFASEWKPPTEQLASLPVGARALGGGSGKAPAGSDASCTLAGAIAMLSNGSVAKLAVQRAEQQAAQPQGADEDCDLHFDELHFGDDGASFERGASTASSAEPSPQVSVSGTKLSKGWRGCRALLCTPQGGVRWRREALPPPGRRSRARLSTTTPWARQAQLCAHTPCAPCPYAAGGALAAALACQGVPRHRCHAAERDGGPARQRQGWRHSDGGSGRGAGTRHRGGHPRGDGGQRGCGPADGAPRRCLLAGPRAGGRAQGRAERSKSGRACCRGLGSGSHQRSGCCWGCFELQRCQGAGIAGSSYLGVQFSRPRPASVCMGGPCRRPALGDGTLWRGTQRLSRDKFSSSRCRWSSPPGPPPKGTCPACPLVCAQSWRPPAGGGAWAPTTLSCCASWDRAPLARCSKCASATQGRSLP